MMNNMNFKSDFDLSDGSYLLNHSVGRPLKNVTDILKQDFLEPWQSSNVEPWHQWLNVISKFTGGLSQLFNSPAEQFCPQTNLSSGLTKLLTSIPRLTSARKIKILMSEIDFPSMGFVMQKALPEGSEIVYLPKSLDVTNIENWKHFIDPDIDLVFVSHAYSNTGQLAPIKEIIALAKQNNALSIIDIAQSAGVIPIDLTELSPDFMIGSSVKWLCGGPGAGYLWLAKEHIETCEPNDVGWFSHQNPFEFDIHHFDYNQSALKFWGGTPSILPFVIAANSINYFVTKIKESNSEVIRHHNLTLQNKIIEHLPEFVVSPFDADKRSGTVILDFLDNQSILEQLAQANVAVDVRENGIRVSPHIYNDENDIERLINIIKLQ